MSKNKGYIRLYKDILEHWVYGDEILFRAWINLLLTVNYSDNKIMFDGELITVHTGETLTSLRKLADKWKCSTKKARNILDILEKEQMITLKKCKKGTLLTIVNYGFYQDSGHTKETVSDTMNDTVSDTMNAHNKIINNTELTNNGIKEREGARAPHGRYSNVLLSDEELTDLQKKYPGMWKDEIESLSNYMATHATHYKPDAHYKILLNWCEKDKNSPAIQHKQNQALNYSQREYTKDQIDAIERRKLGLA